MGAKVGASNKEDEPKATSPTNNEKRPPNSSEQVESQIGDKMPLQPTNQRTNFDTINTNDEDTRVVNVHRDKFINLPNLPNINLPNINLANNIDVKRLTDIFNSYATRKTLATGFFNLALVATNFAQMKALIAPTQGRTTTWNALNIVLMTFIGLSLLLQFIVGIMLVFLAKQGEFIDEDKRNQLIRSNNGATLLVVAISIINIFINVFISL